MDEQSMREIAFIVSQQLKGQSQQQSQEKVTIQIQSMPKNEFDKTINDPDTKIYVVKQEKLEGDNNQSKSNVPYLIKYKKSESEKEEEKNDKENEYVSRREFLALQDQLNSLKLQISTIVNRIGQSTKDSEELNQQETQNPEASLQELNYDPLSRINSTSLNLREPKLNKAQTLCHKYICNHCNSEVHVRASNKMASVVHSIEEENDGKQSHESGLSRKEGSQIYTSPGINTEGAGIQILLEDDEPGWFKQIQEKKSKIRKNINFAFLYADPLVQINNGHLEEFDAPLQTDQEFKQVKQFLQEVNKSYVVRKQAINFEVLKMVLAQKPQIIHISCHGDYDEKQGQFCLAFEEKGTGVLDNISEQRLIDLIGHADDLQVKLVFVSACHSEKIGKIFRNANIPVVVAVNSQTMVLDEVGQLFSRHFYHYLLLGESPQRAFEEAQNTVKGSKIDTFACCCTHAHKPDCIWEKYAKKYGYEKAHQLHSPDCNCPFNNNEHGKNCRFYQNFVNELTSFAIDNYDDPDLPQSLDKDIVHLCCCQNSKEVPHNEINKFVLHGDKINIQTPIYDYLDDGKVVIDQDIEERNKLQHYLDPKMLFGRRLEIQQLCQFLFSDQNDDRLIHIYGSEGLGKSAIANYAAKYTLERGKFIDGVYFIELQNKGTDQGLLTQICTKLDIMIPNCRKEQLCDFIKDQQILIILDRWSQFIAQSKERFNQSINYLVKNTRAVKFIVISYEENDLTEKYLKKCLQITELSKENAAQLLWSSVTNKANIKQFNGYQQLLNHEILQLVPCKPVAILQVAALLSEKTLEQIVEDKKDQVKFQAKEDRDFQGLNWVMNISFKNLEYKFLKEINLLLMLSQFPSGLFESDLDKIANQYGFGNWRNLINLVLSDVENMMTKNANKQHDSFRMVSVSRFDDLNENHYIVQPITTKYINRMVLDQRMKIDMAQKSFYYCFEQIKEIRNVFVDEEIDLYYPSILVQELLKNNTDDLYFQSVHKQNQEKKFLCLESNFLNQLDLNQYQQLSSQDLIVSESDLLNLAFSLATVYAQLGKFEEARSTLTSAAEISSYYRLEVIEANLMLGICCILITQKTKMRDAKNLNEIAERVFINHDLVLELADTFFYDCLIQINEIYAILDRKETQTQYLRLGVSQTSRHGKQHQVISKTQQIESQYEDCRELFEKMRKAYQEKEFNFGIAKADLIEAELIIDLDYGRGISIQFNEDQLESQLSDAIQIFKDLNQTKHQIRALMSLGLYKYRTEKQSADRIYDAKQIVEEALELSQKVGNKQSESQCSELLNKILDKMRIKSKNVFIFAKSFPLVKISDEGHIEPAGSFTRYPQNFRHKIKRVALKMNKEVNLKFDVLSRDILTYVANYGCRVLHLSSEVYSNDSICIEGKYGVAEFVSIPELKKLLAPKGHNLNIDVVILGMPNSTRIANAFFDLGVPFVISFEFESLFLSKFTDNVLLRPQRYKYIYKFSVKFYKNILSELSIFDSWSQAKKFVQNSILKSNRGKLFQEDFGEGAILTTYDKATNQKLFDSNSYSDKQRLRSGSFIDSSRRRGPDNYTKEKEHTPFTGRHKEMHKMIKTLLQTSTRLINVIGLEGVGKTRLVQETAYYLQSRYEFQDGVFLIDLAKIQSLEDIKSRLSELKIDLQLRKEKDKKQLKESILLVLDNVDKLAKKNHHQLDWFISSLLRNFCNIKLILTSKNAYLTQEKSVLFGKVGLLKLKPLNNIEAVDLVLSHFKREITRDELQIYDESTSIHQHLWNSSHIQKCQGVPKYLLMFAEQLNTHPLDNIKVENFAPKKADSQRNNSLFKSQIAQHFLGLSDYPNALRQSIDNGSKSKAWVQICKPNHQRFNNTSDQQSQNQSRRDSHFHKFDELNDMFKNAGESDEDSKNDDQELQKRISMKSDRPSGTGEPRISVGGFLKANETQDSHQDSCCMKEDECVIIWLPLIDHQLTRLTPSDSRSRLNSEVPPEICLTRVQSQAIGQRDQERILIQPNNLAHSQMPSPDKKILDVRFIPIIFQSDQRQTQIKPQEKPRQTRFKDEEVSDDSLKEEANLSKQNRLKRLQSMPNINEGYDALAGIKDRKLTKEMTKVYTGKTKRLSSTKFSETIEKKLSFKSKKGRQYDSKFLEKQLKRRKKKEHDTEKRLGQLLKQESDQTQ